MFTWEFEKKYTWQPFQWRIRVSVSPIGAYGSERVKLNMIYIYYLVASQLFKFKFTDFIYTLTTDDLWPSYVTFDLINIWRYPCCTCDPSLIAIGLQMTQMAGFQSSGDLWPWYVTFDVSISNHTQTEKSLAPTMKNPSPFKILWQLIPFKTWFYCFTSHDCRQRPTQISHMICLHYPHITPKVPAKYITPTHTIRNTLTIWPTLTQIMRFSFIQLYGTPPNPGKVRAIHVNWCTYTVTIMHWLNICVKWLTIELHEWHTVPITW